MRESRHYLFSVACAGMFVFGTILALPGTVIALPTFTAQFELSLADRGVLIGALFGGLLIGSALSGPFVDRAGFRASIAGSAAAIALLLPAFALASSYPVALFALAGVGTTSAALNTAANALSSELFPEQRGRRMNMLAVAVSVGGLLLPTAVALAAGAVSWRAAVGASAAVSGAVAAAALAVTGPSAPALESSWSALRALVRRRGFVPFSLLIACGAANEGVYAGWTSSYLASSGVTPVWATWALSSHWLGLLVGRLVFVNRVDRAKAQAIVRGGLAGAAVLLALIIFPIGPVLALGPFIGGVAIAVVVPTSLALAGERYPGNAGTLFGLLLTTAQVGAMTVPPLIGSVADVTSLRVALLVGVLNSVLVVVLAGRAGRR